MPLRTLRPQTTLSTFIATPAKLRPQSEGSIAAAQLKPRVLGKRVAGVRVAWLVAWLVACECQASEWQACAWRARGWRCAVSSHECQPTVRVSHVKSSHLTRANRR
jgi:hypothetical protein